MRTRYCVERQRDLRKNAKRLTTQRFAANGDRKGGVDEAEAGKNHYSVFFISYP